MAEARARKSTPAADPLQEQMDAAERLARLVAGDDNRQFVLVFHSIVNTLDGFAGKPPEATIAQARSVLLRTAEPLVSQGRRGLGAAPAPPGPPADSIFSDPVYLANAQSMIPDRERIVGGIPTSSLPDCVAVGSGTGWCCTGTLVAPNVVVTAGHCAAGNCASRVFLGDNVAAPRGGTVINVKQAVAHPMYRPPSRTHDLAVLILAKDASVPPRPIATKSMLTSAASVRLAGFGNTDVFSSGGYGIRRIVDVPLASADPKYGADPSTEFVAGAPFLDRDSCNGDSGGPAYVQSRRKWYLAGATSRATASTVRPCGDGGIYTRLSEYDSWIKSIPGGHWT